MIKTPRYLRVGLVLAALTTGVFPGPRARAAADPFPVYSAIAPNVAFWEKIYTRYTSNQGIIHDKRNLGIIYGVIDLLAPEQPGSRKINRQRIKKAKAKYRAILTKLMQRQAPVEPEAQQVAALFGAHATPADFRRARGNLRCQVGQKDRFRAGIIRSGAFLDEIKQIFRTAGLPEDLAYLPHVESSFNPQAYSKFGAAGIWQFTRATGKRFMKVGYTVDERRDPILSSRAAARLLKENYRKFKNWPMAITAYNHGATGMLRARRARGGYEAIFTRHRSRTFKFASRNFYSEFLAAREAAKNYRRYYGDLQLDPPLAYDKVVLAGYASLPVMARGLGLNINTLRRLNPALRNPVFRGQKYIPPGYRLRLPRTGVKNWQALVAELPPDIYRNRQKPSRFYMVRRGDTAGKIARMHGVALDQLIAANNLGPRATIYVRQNLRIPVPGEKKALLASLKVPPTAVKSASAALSASAVAAAAKPPTVPPADRQQSAVSQKPAVALAAEKPLASQAPIIAAPQPPLRSPQSPSATAAVPRTANKAPETAFPLPDLWINPAAADALVRNDQVVTGNLSVERTWLEDGRQVGRIRVEVEETIGHYAEWLGVSARQIRRLNGLRYGRIIRLNQRFKIPLDRVSRAQFEEKRFEYHQQLAEDFFAAYRITEVQTYTIKKGDNIWTLAREKFEVPLWLIRKYNAGVALDALEPSQKLRVPVVEKIA